MDKRTVRRKLGKLLGTVSDILSGPILWGLGAAVGYYLLVHRGLLSSPLVLRYTAGHPIEYAETAMFFIGMAAVLMRVIRLAAQLRCIDAVSLPSPPAGGQTTQDCVGLLAQLERLPGPLRRSWMAERLRNLLQHVQRHGGADDLESELKYHSDRDAQLSYEAYSLVRIIIWAIPMLGFLGTVMGITLALGDLSPTTLVENPKKAMEGLLAGLGVAFDTTALGLTLSIVLMFAQYVTGRLETDVLNRIDHHALEQLAGRFQRVGADRDPHLVSVQRMSSAVLEAVSRLAERQSQLWQNALGETHTKWDLLIRGTAQKVTDTMSQALDISLTKHVQRVRDMEASSEKRTAEKWQHFTESLLQHTAQLARQHEAMEQQTRLLLKILEATGQIATLEQTLNRNLGALAGAKNFEDTVVSLSAAIQLLSSRLGMSLPKHARVQLQDPPSSPAREQAA